MKKNLFSLVLTVLLVFVITSIGVSQEKITKNFNVKKGDNLSVKVSGDVKVESWSKDEVYIEVIGLDQEDVEDLRMKQEGNTISIQLKSHDGEASFYIKTPEHFNLDIKTSGGNLSCSGKFTGNITGTTAGGDVMVQPSVNGNAILTTAGGDINVGDVTGEVKLTTAGGDIGAGKLGGDGKLTTAGGNILVISVEKSITLSTAGGDIRINNVGGEVKASTSGGDISVGTVKGAAKLSTSGGDIKLSGANGRISTNTSGGDIKLENLIGSVSANTSGGEVYVELTPDGNDESNLSSSGGKINLLVPQNSKATIEALIEVDSKRDLKTYKVNSDFKFDRYSVDEDDMKIRGRIILNGGGHLIKLNTVNSNIEIRKLNK
ncbi:MAG: DUF4097 family beta strand repeat protein [Ignavibacteriaceae bacterium]|nr:DUF4097 family beta strand repeat protein [Ignavibacteriaceae bacterium]